MIFMFLFVDTLILMVWYMVDPLRKTKKYLYADDQVQFFIYVLCNDQCCKKYKAKNLVNRVNVFGIRNEGH